MSAEPSNGWRADIEGLRALAIVPVLLFHYDSRLAPGGFLGVDVFLVISGFLIARMLLGSEGRYTSDVAGVIAFLRRRALRIMPALAITVATFAPLFAFLAIPGEHDPFFRTGFAALIGLSNVQLARRGDDYFAAAAELNPFLHTWSVSVEDQFYIGFVLVMALLARARGQRTLPRAVLALAVAASAYAWFDSPTASSKASFYLPESRAWEFLVGGAAFVISQSAGSRAVNALRPLRWIAIAALVGAYAFAAAHSLRHATLVVVALATAVLVGAQPTRRDPSAFLNASLFRAIGRRAYALYLIHYPVARLIELRFGLGLSNVTAALLYLFCTVALAELVHRFVEQPFIDRYKRDAEPRALARIPAWTLWGSAASIAFATILLFPRVSIARHLTPRLSRPEMRSVSGSGRVSMLIIGDSHAQQLIPIFERLAVTRGMGILDATGSGCFASEHIRAQQRRSEPPDDCAAWIRVAIDSFIADSTTTRVAFIGNRAVAYLAPQLISRFDSPNRHMFIGDSTYAASDPPTWRAIERSLIETTRRLGSSGIPTIYLAQLPEMTAPYYVCAYRAPGFRCAVSRDAELKYRQPFMEMARTVAATVPSFSIWDPLSLICPDASCTPSRNDTIVFRDDDHLSVEMVLGLERSFTAHLDSILTAPSPANTRRR